MTKCIALGTSATFAYKPDDSEMKTYLAKKHKVRVSTYETKKLTPNEIEEASTFLINKEANKLLCDRKCTGDASETGLIKFCESLMPIE